MASDRKPPAKTHKRRGLNADANFTCGGTGGGKVMVLSVLIKGHIKGHIDQSTYGGCPWILTNVYQQYFGTIILPRYGARVSARVSAGVAIECARVCISVSTRVGVCIYVYFRMRMSE